MISFLTPYWNGREMMRIHLASIRKFYPAAPILISKKGGDREEMEAHRAEFGIRYWIEDCDYVDALLHLLERCETEYACVSDHDAVLLADPDYLLRGLMEDRWDLVGIEERIRELPGASWVQLQPQSNGWFRFAPGYVDATFLMFNLRAFVRRWGLRGVAGKRPFGAHSYEYHYGICEKLKRHKYLLPYHAGKYGFGNLLKDGETAVLWHQWMGSNQQKLVSAAVEAYSPGIREMVATAKQSERAFLTDYPNLDLSHLSPAWGKDWDIAAEQLMAEKNYPSPIERLSKSLQRWRGYGLRGFLSHVTARFDRWRLLYFRPDS